MNTTRTNNTFRNLGVSLAIACFTPVALADLDLLQGQFEIEIEEAAALANQATYDQLIASGCTDSQRNATTSCSGLTFVTFNAVRELVHNANELLGDGPTEFSLGLDLEGLGFALRWTAGEEFSSHGNLSNNFVQGQVAGLATRLSAIRSGASGFAFNGVNQSGQAIASNSYFGQSGGSAGSPEYEWSPYGSFINFSYRYGDRDPSQRENAYDFEGYDLNFGGDYRFDDNHVVGVIFGYQDESIDFDSSQSIVEGIADLEGFSTQVFYMYQSDTYYLSAASGYQTLSFELDRRISYPSLNPDVASTNTNAVSDTDSDSYSLFLSGGYTFNPMPKVSLEPYVSADYRAITVDEFTERDLNSDGFNFVVAEQDIDSLETSVGLRLSYVLTPSFGVFIPYFDAQLRNQLEDDERSIRAFYANASEALTDTNAASFDLLVDAPDSSYQVYTFGMSMVLRGASSSAVGQAASGGLSAFLFYKTFADIDFVSQEQISGGIRYEF